jgi:hypothetical protein
LVAAKLELAIAEAQRRLTVPRDREVAERTVPGYVDKDSSPDLLYVSSEQRSFSSGNEALHLWFPKIVVKP